MPNAHACPIYLGMPDALPVISKGTVDYTVMTVLAPTCIITEFDCKNYSYLDTPKGYQISQHYASIGSQAHFHLVLWERGSTKIMLLRADRKHQ